VKKDKLNQIAGVERAIREKYGDEAIANPKANWDDEKEKDYLSQLKELSKKDREAHYKKETIDNNGILITKKLIKKDIVKRNCPVCEKYSFDTKDDVYMKKLDCCYKCYIQYVNGREDRWKSGWRPQLGESNG
jgi:hypothetical protein